MPSARSLHVVLALALTAPAVAEELTPAQGPTLFESEPQFASTQSWEPVHPTLAALARATSGESRPAESYFPWEDDRPTRRPLEDRLRQLAASVSTPSAPTMAEQIEPIQTPTRDLAAPEIRPVAYESPVVSESATPSADTPASLSGPYSPAGGFSRNPLRASSSGSSSNPLR